MDPDKLHRRRVLDLPFPQAFFILRGEASQHDLLGLLLSYCAFFAAVSVLVDCDGARTTLRVLVGDFDMLLLVRKSYSMLAQ